MTSGAGVLQVGLAIGQGTGPELADVFMKTLSRLGGFYQLQIELQTSPKVYHSYHSLFLGGNSKEHIHKETMQDAQHYEQFCKDQAARGTRVIFRTAITAQSLYLVRERLEAVKVERFDQGSASMLLIRDQAQGFYCGSNRYDVDMAAVSRTTHFSKRLMGQMVTYGIKRARQTWGSHTIVDSVIMVYKHHLFDGVFDAWANEMSKEHGIKVQFIQPDTMNRNLLAFGMTGHQVMVAANEYADIMEVIFLDMFGQGVQETSYSENVYLHKQLNDLSEFQTVHGSADDISGKGIVNPTATIKAAVTILGRYGGCKGVKEALDNTVRKLNRQNVVTPDQGGNTSTSAFLDAILADVLTTLSPARTIELKSSPKTYIASREGLSDMGMRTGLIVMDFQNDFGTRFGTKPDHDHSLSVENLTSNIALVTKSTREQHREVLFVRFLGDKDFQLPNWQYRDAALGRETYCHSDTLGADFISPVKPVPGERMFDKKAFFDAFLCDGFEKRLKSRGLKHLILVGLYGDVCVDSTARTAFQKGYYITIVSDCVGTLHMPSQDYLNFARKVYGARIIAHAELLKLAEFERQKTVPLRFAKMA